MNTKKVAYLGLFIALAFVLSYVEFLLPFNIGIPGAKIGLANLVVMVALYTAGTKDAFLLSIGELNLDKNEDSDNSCDTI